MTDAEETPPVAATPFKQPPANLPPPKSLVVDDNLASNWKQWKKVWQRYEIVMGIYKQEDLVRGLRVSKLLAIIGEDAVKAYLIRLPGAKLRRKIVLWMCKPIFTEYCEPAHRYFTKAIVSTIGTTKRQAKVEVRD